MDSFRYISAVLAMVLGLGLTRLLSSLIAVFRSRHRAEMDWLPLAWAFGIVFTQLQYWWAINQLPEVMTSWTFEHFVALVAFTMLLFVAAALLLPLTELPEGGSLKTFFEEEGRWSLLALSVYFGLTLAVDSVYFGSSLLRPWAALNLLAMAFPLAVFLVPSRRARVAITLVAVPFFIFDLVAMSDEYLFGFLDWSEAR